jgi:hypothetical protein
MSSMTRRWAGRAAIPCFAALLAVFVAACGGSSSTAASATPSLTPSASTSVSPTAAITSNWQMFFAGTTKAADKIALLQNGQQFSQTIQAQANSPLAQATQAKVTAVTLVSGTGADVTYSILQGGQVALPDQHGQAVLENGVWKVSAASFQALLQLEQGQSGASPSASP